jgi:hypothetical protein
VVVHDSSGTRVACGVLESTPGEVVQLGPYPGYVGMYGNVTGTVVVAPAENGGISLTGAALLDKKLAAFRSLCRINYLASKSEAIVIWAM